ncbi:hypothetical protein PLICRDRAFT_178507 [Plicaturopsis crispa FD-325 SS-3]|nr:hypothetical protein PLICRDRAFT_178507 [Plicaturopsis crispa FD-325 SS-3]
MNQSPYVGNAPLHAEDGRAQTGPKPWDVPDPIPDRFVQSVPPPATHKPTDEDLFYLDAFGGRRPNPEYLKQHFLREGRITESQALWILDQTTQVLAREPNLVAVNSPVTICGDIHGQYYDLMKLFEVGGNFSDNSYLFLGDYVDRGSFGIECLLYLYALKLWYPTKMTMLRGNHECRHLTEYFTFKRECLHKYSPRVYEACLQSFNALPLAALVDGRFFCVHGGISPELHTLDDIMRLNRFQEPGSHGLLCDLLWSDPIVNYGHEEDAVNGVPPGTTFMHNATRGCSFFYTYTAACQFLERNQLLGIIRGHEAQDAGYTMHRKTPTKKFPSVITIFSAPDYLDVYKNRGAVIKYANKNITIRQYHSSPHPFWLPNFMDAFTWSLPFMGMKIADMLLAILKVCSDEELEDSSEEGSDDDTRTLMDVALTPSEIAQRRQQIKNKVLAVGRMQRVFQLLREEAENATELYTTPDTGDEDGGLGVHLITDNTLGIQGNRMHIHNFDEARRSDLINERIPEFTPTAYPQPGAITPTPSMRSTLRRGSGDDADRGPAMETLIRRTLEDEEGDGGVVEKLAERIARGRKATGRPQALKRHDTV